MKRTARVSSIVALAVALLWCCAPGPANAQPIEGDLNGDDFVGALDLQIILNNWNQVVPVGKLSRGDLAADGFIDIVDLSFLLTNWGAGTIPTPGGNASIGMNLSEVTYYSREWVFVDAMKSARPWVSTNPNGQPFSTGQTVQTDANGWPELQQGQAAHTLLLIEKPEVLPPETSTSNGYPAGTYNVYFDTDAGKIDLEFEFDATNVKNIGEGHKTFEVTTPSKNGILMRVIGLESGTNRATNIRVMMPDYDDASQSPFHDTYIQRLLPFGVIRFMDWQHTNLKQTTEANPSYDWADRTTPNHFTQDTRHGVSLEYMIKLCNELGADAWFCMPHEASDDFVRGFAETVRYGDPAKNIPKLNSGLKVYVEWSNEVWNTQFPQSKWVNEQSGENIFSDKWFWTWASEAARDFAIWHEVFSADYKEPGDEDRRIDIFRVAAGQQANVWVTGKLVEAFDNPAPEFGPALGSPYDAISCAAYFDHRNTPFDASTTKQDIIDNAINHTIPNIYTGYYQDHGELSQRLTNEQNREIPLLAYEAGQHYTVHGNASKPYFQAFKDVQEYENPDPSIKDMYDAYTANMRAFDQAGGSLFMAYNYVRKQDQHGSWGHLRYQDQSKTTAPKYRALIDFNSE